MAALDVAVHYSDRRKAFGQKIRAFEAMSFKIAEASTLLDAARSLVWNTARAIDAGDRPERLRRLVSESKKFSTEAAWTIVNHAMQILGGIGYTNVFPVERLLRDARLGLIWTGTSEIMDLIIQHEVYRELGAALLGRDVEADAEASESEEEKVFE
jgi:acyl-CoA dehydrogenase